jgi:hypothetical protein
MERTMSGLFARIALGRKDTLDRRARLGGNCLQ